MRLNAAATRCFRKEAGTSAADPTNFLARNLALHLRVPACRLVLNISRFIVLPGDIVGLISPYGPLLVGGMILLECICIPIPGETILLTAAGYASTGHGPGIESIFAAGIAGAVCGNLIAFWIGRRYGLEMLLRYGSYIRLNRTRLKIGQYLFLRHGKKFVIFARLIPLLRSFAGILAGANCMPPTSFAIANLVGAFLWVGMDCTAAFFLLKELRRFAVWDAIAILSIIILGVGAVAMGWARYERRLKACAERSLPDDLKVPARSA